MVLTGLGLNATALALGLNSFAFGLIDSLVGSAGLVVLATQSSTLLVTPAKASLAAFAAFRSANEGICGSVLFFNAEGAAFVAGLLGREAIVASFSWGVLFVEAAGMEFDVLTASLAADASMLLPARMSCCFFSSLASKGKRSVGTGVFS